MFAFLGWVMSNLRMCFLRSNRVDAKGVLVIDHYGLPVESVGNFDPAQSGIISSLMRNVAQLSQTVLQIDK